MLQACLSWQQEMSFPCLDAGWQGAVKYPNSLHSFLSHEETAVTERTSPAEASQRSGNFFVRPLDASAEQNHFNASSRYY